MIYVDSPTSCSSESRIRSHHEGEMTLSQHREEVKVLTALVHREWLKKRKEELGSAADVVNARESVAVAREQLELQARRQRLRDNKKHFLAAKRRDADLQRTNLFRVLAHREAQRSPPRSASLPAITRKKHKRKPKLEEPEPEVTPRIKLKEEPGARLFHQGNVMRDFKQQWVDEQREVLAAQLRAETPFRPDTSLSGGVRRAGSARGRSHSPACSTRGVSGACTAGVVQQAPEDPPFQPNLDHARNEFLRPGTPTARGRAGSPAAPSQHSSPERWLTDPADSSVLDKIDRLVSLATSAFQGNTDNDTTQDEGSTIPVHHRLHLDATRHTLRRREAREFYFTQRDAGVIGSGSGTPTAKLTSGTRESEEWLNSLVYSKAASRQAVQQIHRERARPRSTTPTHTRKRDIRLHEEAFLQKAVQQEKERAQAERTSDAANVGHYISNTTRRRAERKRKRELLDFFHLHNGGPGESGAIRLADIEENNYDPFTAAALPLLRGKGEQFTYPELVLLLRGARTGSLVVCRRDPPRRTPEYDLAGALQVEQEVAITPRHAPANLHNILFQEAKEKETRAVERKQRYATLRRQKEDAACTFAPATLQRRSHSAGAASSFHMVPRCYTAELARRDEILRSIDEGEEEQGAQKQFEKSKVDILDRLDRFLM